MNEILETIEKYRSADDPPHHALDEIERMAKLWINEYEDLQRKLDEAYLEINKLNRRVIESLSIEERFKLMIGTDELAKLRADNDKWRAFFFDESVGEYIKCISDTTGLSDQEVIAKSVRLAVSLIDGSSAH